MKDSIGIAGEENGMFYMGSASGQDFDRVDNGFATHTNYSPLDMGVEAKARIRFGGAHQVFGFGQEAIINRTIPGDICIRVHTRKRENEEENALYLHVAVCDNNGTWNTTYLDTVPMVIDEFHIIAIEWRPTTAHFYLDGSEVGFTEIPVACNQELTFNSGCSPLMEVDWVSARPIESFNVSSTINRSKNERVKLHC